jgi:hypothetical protein
MLQLLLLLLELMAVLRVAYDQQMQLLALHAMQCSCCSVLLLPRVSCQQATNQNKQCYKYKDWRI